MSTLRSAFVEEAGEVVAVAGGLGGLALALFFGTEGTVGAPAEAVFVAGAGGEGDGG